MIAVIKQVKAMSLPEALQPLIAEAHALALACNREAFFFVPAPFSKTRPGAGPPIKKGSFQRARRGCAP